MTVKAQRPVEIVPFLKRSDIFQRLDDTLLEPIVPSLEWIQAAAGEVLIEEGEEGDCLYLVYEGRLKVEAADEQGAAIFLSEVNKGESVGEIALLVGGQRMATVTAVVDTQLLELKREAVDALPAAVRQQLSQAIWTKFERAQLNRAFYVNRLLSRLDDEALDELREELELVHLSGGEVLIEQGAASHELYIVISGRLLVVRLHEDGTQTPLLELGRGETVGEMGVFTEDIRTATVYALRDTLLARLSQEGFYRLMGRHPHAMTRQFLAAVIARLRGQILGTIRPRKTVTTLAIVPAHDGRFLQPFTRQLVEALSKIGRTLYLNSERVDGYLSKVGIAQVRVDDPADVQLFRWLSEQEMTFDYVVYEADLTESVWTQRCVRQADRLVVVGEADAAAVRDPLAEKARQQTFTPSVFVLLQSAAADLPHISPAWHAWLSPEQPHYHIRKGDPADFARLGRLVTGNGVGLVLSGGGARGFAHIGVWRALREAGVPVDLIGGSSIGGFIACEVAMGWNHETIMAKNHGALRHRFDYTFPVTALMAGGEMTAVTQEIFGETLLEALWLPCFCTTTNLSTAELMVHTHGPVWKYTRATTSIPGILPPVIDNNQMLIDGGILNNLPTDVMRQRSDVGRVVAVDVSVPADLSLQTAPFETHLSGWQVLWQRLNPFTAALNVPAMSDILMRVGGISDSRKAQSSKNLADVFIRVALDQYGTLEFGALNQIEEGGYQAAVAQIALLKENDDVFRQLMQ